MNPTDKVLKEFDEKFPDMKWSTWVKYHNRHRGTSEEIKSFITTALTQAYRRGVEETARAAMKLYVDGEQKGQPEIGMNDALNYLNHLIEEARLTETPL